MVDRSVDSFALWSADAASVLSTAAGAAASTHDCARAVALAWSSDLYALQGRLWHQLIGDQQRSRREYFQVLQEVVALGEPVPAGCATAADYLSEARTRLWSGLGEWLPEGASSADIPGLAELPAPTEGDWAALRSVLVGDGDPAALIHARRRQAADLMLRALRAQQAEDDPEAIRLAYDSDMASLEAYLIESATTARDSAFITVAARWALVSDRMGRLTALPADFSSAVRAVRTVLAEALGDSDGARMLAGLQPFGAA